MLNSRAPRRDTTTAYRVRSAKSDNARRRGAVTMSGETCLRRVGITRFQLNNHLATYVRGAQLKIRLYPSTFIPLYLVYEAPTTE
jgi:hypothetical protein